VTRVTVPIGQVRRQIGGSVRVLPTFPVAQRHAVDRRNLEADLPPVRVTGLLEASVGRWLRFLIEAVPPRHGHIMPELARDMRQMRTFAPRMAMYKYTEQATIQ